jgi:biopolymer transport protein ExbD
MSTWYVRHEGSPRVVELPDAQHVLEGLREGDWMPTDEIRGPGEARFLPLEDHPVFADAVADMEPPPAEHPDETRLDMNPLIDVALVLLVFFILTATYTTLRRAIDLPPEPEAEDKGVKVIKTEDIKDRAFKVKVRMDNGKPVITVNDSAVLFEEIDNAILEVVRTTGRKEMYADVAPDVPWGIEARIYDAAKGAEIHQIYWPKGR